MHPLDVYRKLPRTNCGKCSSGTCMSFAIQLLRRIVSLSECPDLDEEPKKEIEAMLSDTGDWKEKRLKELFEEISQVNFSKIADGIGAVSEKDILKIRYLGKKVLLSHSDFKNALGIWDKLIVLLYVKNAANRQLSDKWVAFRDLKDGMIRAESFHDACEVSLARMFENNKEWFLNRLIAMGAEKVAGFSADYSLVIYPLPRIPFLILLWSEDEGFEADCKILLDSTTTEFLDVEALLYLGMALVRAMK